MIPADVDAGPAPEDNLPGHEQDQPDLVAMDERLGTVPPEEHLDADTAMPSPRQGLAGSRWWTATSSWP